MLAYSSVTSFSLSDWFFRFIPVPVVGTAALHKRMKLQEQECSQQQSRLEVRTDVGNNPTHPARERHGGANPTYLIRTCKNSFLISMFLCAQEYH